MDLPPETLHSFFDRALIVSTVPIQEIVLFSSKIGERKNMGISMEKDSLSLTFIFPRDLIMKGQNVVFSKHFRVHEKGNSLILQRQLERNRKLVYFMNSILKTNSVILRNAYLENGRYFFTFLFSSSQSRDVSDVLVQHADEVADFRINYLGPSDRFFLNDESNRNLIVVIIQSVPEPDQTGMENNPMGSEWLRMVKLPYGSSNVEGVYMFQDSAEAPSSGSGVINSKMYSTVTENEVLEYMTKRFLEESVVTENQIHLLHEGKFYIYMTMQELFRIEFIKIFNEICSKYPRWNLSLLQLENMYEYMENGDYRNLL